MSRRRKRRKKNPFPWTELFAALAAFAVFAGALYWAYLTFLKPAPALEAENTSRREDPVMLSFTEPAGRWEPREVTTHANILLLGLDDSGLSDLIMIASYDTVSFEPALLAIKRDTFVEEQPWGRPRIGQSQLAWSNYHGILDGEDYHDGARLTAYTVEKMLDIEIHSYVSINFQGFIDLIDAIGGVTLTVPPGFAERQGETLPVGRQHLNGAQALIYARHRMNPRIPEPGSTSEDGDRIKRNQALLEAIFAQVKEMESEELLSLVDRLEGDLATSMDDWDLLQLANIFYHRDLDNLAAAVLPGEGSMFYEELLEESVYYYFLDYEESEKLLLELGIKRF